MINNIILVHGAWADGSSWNHVIPVLKAAGCNIAATQHPLTSLKEDVEITRRLAEAQDGSVLLVGHSYGGYYYGSRPPMLTSSRVGICSCFCA